MYYKMSDYIKKEPSDEEISDDESNVYADSLLSNDRDEVNPQNMDVKSEIIAKFSDSENDDETDEDVTFDDLYEKVFEDVRKDASKDLDTETSPKYFPLKIRRRGRPPIKRRDFVDDPDLLLDEIQAKLKKKANEDNDQENDSRKTVIAKIGEEVFEEESVPLPFQASAKGRNPLTTPKKKIHRNGPPFMCELCDHPCKSRALLNSHRFRKHRPPDKPNFHCPECDRGFTSQEALDRHMRRPTCNAYPQFDCEHCGKKCVGLSNYKIHMRFHKRQYPFVCHLCGKKFMMRVHLNEHVLVKHENKRYPCEQPGCGKLFQTRNSLYNHAYLHKGFMPYECEHCLRGYASKSRLRTHLRKSHGVDHTIAELDRMQVTEKLPNPVVKPQ